MKTRLNFVPVEPWRRMRKIGIAKTRKTTERIGIAKTSETAERIGRRIVTGGRIGIAKRNETGERIEKRNETAKTKAAGIEPTTRIGEMTEKAREVGVTGDQFHTEKYNRLEFRLFHPFLTNAWQVFWGRVSRPVNASQYPEN